MNGFIIVNKEKNYTSRDVVNIIASILNTKKVGHTGTLDPIATGVLVVGVGKALKVSELLMATYKEYEAKVILGYETDTLDVAGKITKTSNQKVTSAEITAVLRHFKGTIKQEVPVYSAVKVNGKKLYEYARHHQEVILPIKEVNISSLELISDLVEVDNHQEFSIRCLVSKGTYIRSLVRDIGRYLGTYATMKELVRTKQGKFSIDSSFTIEDIKNNNYKLLSLEEVLDLKKVYVSDDMLPKIKNGNKLKRFFDEDMVMLIDKNDKLVAIYKIDENDSEIVRPYKMF